eukprot:TRINITY_DN28325_c0_g1_i1.p1 TRINITY_DN28325_c0_g1~~TRINITY_DN28325_c0_g1_i1.p1  ORF type:complete len:101 (-),score=38.40 TRINITY_DN28325_c0_g1_i1:44-346(-)
MIRRPPRSTLSSSSAASDVYKRQVQLENLKDPPLVGQPTGVLQMSVGVGSTVDVEVGPAVSRLAFNLSLIHISEPTRLLSISYAVFCLKKKKKKSVITTI